MHHVLLIEDSLETAALVKRALEESDCEVHVAETLAAGKAALGEHQEYSLVLLDLGLPDGDGLDFCDEWTRSPGARDGSILVLSARQELSHKISALATGADDYLVKPFHPLELKARVEAKLRARETRRSVGEVLARGVLRIDLRAQRVEVIDGGGRFTPDFTAKEFRLLCYLAAQPGRTFSRAQLIASVWGASTHVVGRAVDTHIAAIRKKLGPAAPHIESIIGVGYRFKS